VSFRETGLWRDLREGPAALAATVDARDGVDAAAALLRSEDVRRVVAVGNGAAYYVAHALWLAALESDGDGPALVAVPCGVAAAETFRWRPRDAVLAVSSSGEFRDVVQIADRAGAAGRPCVAVTAAEESSLAGTATATVLQRVDHQRAVTHTQALWGGYAAALGLWAAVTGDRDLRAVVDTAPACAARAVVAADAWASEALGGVERPVAAVVAGGGPAWAGALEAALMLKEIARVPAEGVETREGATSSMFGLDRGHLMVSLDAPGEPAGDEAVRLCAAAGAATLRLPALTDADPRLALVTSLPAAAALAAALAARGGPDGDHPTWTDAYYATARSSP
jgi:glucosamine--fructose-6-phosphate aminotransferase (isomerizing)